MSIRIVIGGSRSCGKSTFSASLYTELQAMGASVGIHEVDVYSDTIPCILGLKPWSKRVKKKHAWFYPTIARRIAEFSDDKHDIVLGDLPGKITNQFLSQMVTPAHGAIILDRDYAGIDRWNAFFVQQGIPVVARILSHLETGPIIPPAHGIRFICGLTRQLHTSPTLCELATELALQHSPQIATRLARKG